MKSLLTAHWTDLAVATYQVDKKALLPWLPYKTELNDWNGNYYMSLLGFLFSKPVIAGIPSPLFRQFEEINLRFYIRYKKNRDWYNGVVFIKEIVPYYLIGLAAGILYRENFTSLPMKHRIKVSESYRETGYYWKTKKQWNHLELTSSLLPIEPANLSLEAFTRDNYRACTRNGMNRTRSSASNIPPGRSIPVFRWICNLMQKVYMDQGL